MKHHKVLKMYGPTMQCIVKHVVRLSATVPNLCPQHKSSLINCLINDRLLDAWRTIIQMSPHLSISHRILISPLV